MDFLIERYNEFITEYDPYYQEEENYSLEEMLYNLLNIQEEFDKVENPELYEVLEATIQQFKAAGIEI